MESSLLILLDPCVELPHVSSSSAPSHNGDSSEKDLPRMYACPLTRPNVFGIQPEHNLRFDCDGSKFGRNTLNKHLENYHRMLPACASRLRNAVVNGLCPDETKLFSEVDILLVRSSIRAVRERSEFCVFLSEPELFHRLPTDECKPDIWLTLVTVPVEAYSMHEKATDPIGLVHTLSSVPSGKA